MPTNNELMSTLFYNCAFDMTYEQAGDSVNYAFIEKDSKLTIYFQGSNSITDWVRNFLFRKRPYKDMEAPYKVHRGFLAAWKEVEDIIIKKITEKENKLVFNRKTKKYEEKSLFKFKDITVVGYSHGGSLTFFATECLWYHRPDLRDGGFRSYAFESPRVFGSFSIPKNLKERWANMTVIRTGSDIVTHCPPVIFGYCHAGTVLKLKGDPSLVKKNIPTCVKYHYPEVVLKALQDYEKKLEENKK